MIIELKDSSYLKQIASIHKKELEGDFLPSLGESFLYTLYCGVMKDKNNVIFAELENEQILGFVFGTKDTPKMMKNVVKNEFIPFIFKSIRAIIKRPGLIKHFIETFSYKDKESKLDTSSELVVIAVDSNSHKKGIGKKLIYTLNEWFKRKNIYEYKLTVNKNNENANGFYKHMGFIYQYTFNLYKKDWNMYLYRIDKNE